MKRPFQVTQKRRDVLDQQIAACVSNAYRSDDSTIFSSCLCNSGYSQLGNTCVQNPVSTCSGLCATCCSTTDPTYCLTCVENAYKLNPTSIYSECICNAGFTSQSNKCVAISPILSSPSKSVDFYLGENPVVLSTPYLEISHINS